jgi:FkbM family methyltransferase
MTPHEINERARAALCCPHTNLVELLIKEKPGIVFDIGALTGGYIQYWLDLGATKVHAFEPVPWNFAAMSATWGSNKNVKLHQVGISDRAESIKGALVYNAHTLARPGEVKLPEAAEHPGQKFDFELMPIDSFMLMNGIKSVSFIKLDVDGYEPKALRGMAATLAVHRPAFMIELSGLPEALGESSAGMIDFLYAAGYKICTMDSRVCENPHVVMDYYPHHTSFDVCAVPNERILAAWQRVK